jgi:small subunit ribosomal protein S1
VVTFGAFVEILPGVEGLVHISELAQHHVENPREVVSQGDAVNVLILEVDAERRRLSLSLKRVEEGQEPLPRADGGESVHLTPNLNLSEDVFPAGSAGLEEAPPLDEAPPLEDAEALAEVEAEVEGADAPEAEPVAEAEPEPVAEAEPEPLAEAEPEGEPEVELEDAPAPESDAAAEVEVEAETTADSEAAAGDEPVDESTADAEAASGDEPQTA